MNKLFSKSLFDPAFVACALLLIVASTAKTIIIHTGGFQLVKYPLPLKKPLSQMDEQRLAPYLVRNKAKIENRDVIETLGTEEYLQWIIEDPDAEPFSPTRFCSIFVTYYTGNPDMVPHVPDECYVGGGNVRLTAYEDSALLRRANESNEKIGYQNVLFGNTNDPNAITEVRFFVCYLFHANGQYSASRTQTRQILGSNFFSRYSYFSKVEWQFYGLDAFGRVYPTRPQVVQASEKLLNVLLPVLEQDHWPDWQAANQKEK